MQKDMLKEIDNYALLLSYGIDCNEAKSHSSELKDEELRLNHS